MALSKYIATSLFSGSHGFKCARVPVIAKLEQCTFTCSKIIYCTVVLVFLWRIIGSFAVGFREGRVGAVTVLVGAAEPVTMDMSLVIVVSWAELG